MNTINPNCFLHICYIFALKLWRNMEYGHSTEFSADNLAKPARSAWQLWLPCLTSVFSR